MTMVKRKRRLKKKYRILFTLLLAALAVLLTVLIVVACRKGENAALHPLCRFPLLVRVPPDWRIFLLMMEFLPYRAARRLNLSLRQMDRFPVKAKM